MSCLLVACIAKAVGQGKNEKKKATRPTASGRSNGQRQTEDEAYLRHPHSGINEAHTPENEAVDHNSRMPVRVAWEHEWFASQRLLRGDIKIVGGCLGSRIFKVNIFGHLFFAFIKIEHLSSIRLLYLQ